MCSMKRVRLAVLFLIVAALLAGMPATAAAGRLEINRPERVVVSADLVPTGTSGEPNASGVAKFQGDLYWSLEGGVWVRGDLTVTCAGLSPFETYWVCVPYIFTSDAFTADANGNWGWKLSWWWPDEFTVWVCREDMVDGTPTLVPVLEGALVCH